MYSVVRSILFCFDPEKVHYFSMNGLSILCRVPLINTVIKHMYAAEDDDYKVFGLNFKNRVGLGAGFDKNARYLQELEMLGFGFVEIGTVTPVAQGGNDTPRLFRLPKDKALI